jgi:DNA sulfur modification protein DndE
MADRLYTSSESDEVLSALRFETKLEKVTLARIAFTLSLVKDGANVAQSPSFGGGEMKRPTFVADDEVFLRTLIAHTYGKRDFTEDEFFSNRSIVKNHIDSGAALLAQMFHETGNSGEALIRRLVDEVEFSGRREQLGSGLDIFIGRTLLQRTELVMELNNTTRHANSHLAIMGKPGVGKTQFLLKILTDIRIQSSFQTNFIYFDYKGDVVDNARFLELARVQPFRLLQGGQSLPINSFHSAGVRRSDDQRVGAGEGRELCVDQQQAWRRAEGSTNRGDSRRLRQARRFSDALSGLPRRSRSRCSSVRRGWQERTTVSLRYCGTSPTLICSGAMAAKARPWTESQTERC